MDNYICIDGVKVSLNDSQISELRAIFEKRETEKNSPFKRQKYGDDYYYINSSGKVGIITDFTYDSDLTHYNNANYCIDEELLKQRALEEILARRLWRYSMEHGGDKIDWSDGQSKYAIYYDTGIGSFYITSNVVCQITSTTYFVDRETALNAIKEVVEPFIKEYPDFKSYRTCYTNSKGE